MTALVLAAVLAASVQARPADPAAGQAVLQRIYVQASRALVQVGDAPEHAGAVLSESGIIATTAEGLAGRASVAITFANGFRASADVVAVDEKLGVALLHAGGLPPMAYLPLGAHPVQQGQAAYAAHFTQRLRPSVTFARVASTRVARDGRIDDRLFTAPFELKAAHGGPVLSYGGEVLGLLMVNGADGVGFALGARALLEFIGAHAAQLPTTVLRVESDPSGAQVLLDGKPAGQTPATIPGLGAGEHLLTLRAPGLPDVLRRLVALGAARQAVRATLFPGAAVHLEAPAGAQVYVDGLLRASGSATLWLPGGKHLVQATLAGFRPYARQLEIVEGRPLSLPITLVPQHATLSVDSTPPGAEVMLDDNRIGQTPLEAAQVAPGTYELTVARPGSHTLKRPVEIPDGADVNLGALKLLPPHLLLAVHAPPGSEIAIDGQPRHPVKPVEEVAPGQHQAVVYAPYQFAAKASFHGEDGEKVELAPVFVAAGNPERQVAHVFADIIQGGAGVLGLVATGFFISAENDRQSNRAGLSDAGRGQLSTGLITGGIGLGLYAVSLFVDSLRPTPQMGFDRTASGEPIDHAAAH